MEEIEGCWIKPRTAIEPDFFLPLTAFDTRYIKIPYIQGVAFYPSHGCSEEDSMRRIPYVKSRLQDALSHFYPFAGRPTLQRNPLQLRWGIQCNNCGVEWTVARAGFNLSELDYSQPSGRFSQLMRNGTYSRRLAGPLLSIQMTVFKCGGISMAWASNHVVADGMSTIHFLRSWGEFCREGSISLPPYIRDTHFETAYPNLIPEKHMWRRIAQNYSGIDSWEEMETLSSRIFCYGEEDLDRLKEHAGTGFSRFQVLSGHIWINMCVARGLPDTQVTKNSVTVNCRSRLVPPLPSEYFGNAVLHAVAETTVGELRRGGIGYAAGLIKEAINGLNMQLIENMLRDSQIAANGLKEGCNMLCSSSPRLPMYEIDLGWGAPDAVRYVGLENHGLDGICLFDPSPRSPGAIEVTVCLPAATLNRLESLLNV